MIGFEKISGDILARPQAKAEIGAALQNGSAGKNKSYNYNAGQRTDDNRFGFR